MQSKGVHPNAGRVSLPNDIHRHPRALSPALSTASPAIHKWWPPTAFGHFVRAIALLFSGSARRGPRFKAPHGIGCDLGYCNTVHGCFPAMRAFRKRVSSPSSVSRETVASPSRPSNEKKALRWPSHAAIRIQSSTAFRLTIHSDIHSDIHHTSGTPLHPFQTTYAEHCHRIGPRMA